MHKSRAGIDDCGKLVLLLGGGLASPSGDLIYLLIEVTAEEMQQMRVKRMNWQQMVSFLGLEFPEQ